MRKINTNSLISQQQRLQWRGQTVFINLLEMMVEGRGGIVAVNDVLKAGVLSAGNWALAPRLSSVHISVVK